MRKIILCDLDGTLADCSHRLHRILKTPKDWDSFFAACRDDKPIWPLIDLINTLARDKYEVWITSGRSDQCWQETCDWLKRFRVDYHALVMRKAGDHTDDSELKVSWLYDGTIPRERVAFALDDRNRVVNAWRAHGITCLQVADGGF